MAFIGNDIIFFNENISTFSRKGVERKVLNEHDLKSFSNFKSPNKLMIAWSIKESIYKILCKEGNHKAFVPTTITITDFEQENPKSFNGTATYNYSKYFFKTEINNEYTYTYSSNDQTSLKKSSNLFFPHHSNQRSDHNIFLTSYLKRNNTFLNHNHNGIPILLNIQNYTDISITHDSNLLILTTFSKNK